MAFLSPGLLSLVLGYVLSQFYRAFLAVLAPQLGAEMGAAPGDLALSSGLWFIAFAVMQLPVGAALDRIGPRRTVAGLLAIGGGGGAAIFALATQPWHLHVAMAALGVGCSPALMGPYYIFARSFPPARFGALAGTMVGLGSAGNILGTAPLVWTIEALGWRATLWGLAAVTLGVAAVIAALVRDPPPAPAAPQAGGQLRAVLGLRALWFILPLFTVSYAAVAAIRGLWVAPWLEQTLGAGARAIGNATLVMGCAMIAGSFLVGPFIRVLGGRVRRAILIQSGALLATLLLLWAVPPVSLVASTALLAGVGLCGAGYPLLMTHGRSFLPPALVGMGVTYLNMFSIGGVGVMQFASRPVFRLASDGRAPAEAFAILWLFFLIPIAVALVLYLRTPEAGEHGG